MRLPMYVRILALKVVMHFERAMINDRLHVQKYPENFAFQLFIILK